MNDNKSYVKIFRSLKNKYFYSKDSEKVHLWIHLLLSVNWEETEEELGGKKIICKPGQFTTGRKQLAIQTGIDESKIERMLNYFEKTEHQIEQQKTSSNRLITIVSWSEYQQSEQQSEQQMNNKCTHLKNIRNISNNKLLDSKKPNKFVAPSLDEVISYLKDKKLSEHFANEFYYYYESNGWMVGKNKMKSWTAALMRWVNTSQSPKVTQQPQQDNSDPDTTVKKIGFHEFTFWSPDKITALDNFMDKVGTNYKDYEEFLKGFEPDNINFGIRYKATDGRKYLITYDLAMKHNYLKNMLMAMASSTGEMYMMERENYLKKQTIKR